MNDFYVDIDLIDPSPFTWLCPPDEENIQLIRVDLDGGGGILTPLHAIEKNDGRWELLTGHDRLEAAKRCGLDHVPVSIRPVLTDEEKVSYVVRDNALRKTVSPRPAVGWFLREHSDWSNRRIATLCGCSEKTVRTVRTSLEASGDLEVVFTRTDTLGREQPATKTGHFATVVPIFGDEKPASLFTAPAAEVAVESGEVAVQKGKGRSKAAEVAERKEQERRHSYERVMGHLAGIAGSALEDWELPDFTEDERQRADVELKAIVRNLNALRRRIMAGLEKDTETNRKEENNA